LLREFTAKSDLPQAGGYNIIKYCQIPVCDLAQKLFRFRKRLRHFAGVFPSSLRAFRPAAAFSTDDWCNLLD
jgi:hypothetical protein